MKQNKENTEYIFIKGRDLKMRGIYVKIHRLRGEVILAACDENLVGKVFRDGPIILNVKEDFYKGKLVSEDEFREILRMATIMNLVGEKCVKIALEEGYLDEDRILYVQGVPHAQMAWMFL